MAGPLIRLLYGPAFDPAVPPFVLLAFTLVPMALNMIVYQILAASNRQAIWTGALAVASVVNPALNFVLIRYFQARLHNGAIGAALSLLLTEILIAALAIVLVWPFLEWRAVRRVRRAFLATLGMAVVVHVGARFGLLADTLAGVVSFAVLAVVFGVLSADERQAIRLRVALAGRRLRGRPVKAAHG